MKTNSSVQLKNSKLYNPLFTELYNTFYQAWLSSCRARETGRSHPIADKLSRRQISQSPG